MPNISGSKKQQRKERIILIVQSRPLGISEAEIAEEMGMSDQRRTIHNYLHELDREGWIYKEDHSTLWLPLRPPKMRLAHFEVSPEEAMTLYLAVRLLAKQQDKRNEAAETALVKLANILTTGAGIGHEIKQAAHELAQRRETKEYEPIFRRVMQGYVYRRKLKLVYRPYQGKPFPTVFATYLLEPSAVGYTTYLIGHSSTPNAIRHYRLDRIQSVEFTREEYVIPADFPGLDILRQAWSIIGGEATQKVVLRFSPDVVEWVLETEWHALQDYEPDPEKPGYLRWWVEVADTTDMLPWIRGWGADVEVLEPERLRKALVRGAQELAQLYKVVELQIGQTLYYGHSRKGSDKSEWQLLKDHLINTAELAGAFGVDAGISELARTAAMLHDIGKYSKAFQARLEGSGRKVDHATAGAREITLLFNDKPQKPLADILAYCIAGHHTGLPDYGSKADMEGDGTLRARLDKSKLEDYSAYRTEIDSATFTLPEWLHVRPIKNFKGKSIQGFTVSFLTRMVFSALVDADFQETETYMHMSKKPRGEYADIEELCQTFNRFLKRFEHPVGDINKKRTETLKACIAKSSEKPI